MNQSPISLEICITKKLSEDPSRQSQNSLDSLQQTFSELECMHAKLRRIKEIDGEPVIFTRMRLSGEEYIQTIELTYTQQEETRTRRYSNKEFYDI